MATDTNEARMKCSSNDGILAGAKPRRLPSISGCPATGRLLRVVETVGVAFAATVCNAQVLPADIPGELRIGQSTSWQITPEISVTETRTDNAALTPASTARKSWVTEYTPGIRIEKTGVRTRIFADFRFHDFRYARNSQFNNNQRLLNSFATMEAIDNLFYVDANANISQQNRSAFSLAAATDASGPNGNRVETATNQISPHIRGKLADIAAYQLRFVGADIRSNDIALPDTKGKQWTGFIKNERARSGFGWAIDGNALSFRNKTVGKAHDERVRASLSYEFDPQVHLTAIGGSENTNFAGTRNGAHTSGIGLEWSPDARTQFAAVKEKRFFGNSHSATISHRTRLSAWKFTSTRDVTALSSQLTASGAGSTAGLLADLLASTIPDPIAREAAVRQQLEASGISGNSALSGGFATGRAFLVRNDEASVAVRGIYNTVTLILLRADRRAFGSASATTDSFSLSNEIRQRGVNLNWVYRLSPHASLSLVGTALRSEGLSTTNLDSNQRSLNLLFSTRIGQNTFATLGTRRVIFENSVNTGYRENAFLGSVSLRY